jgi:hypothetical protein
VPQEGHSYSLTDTTDVPWDGTGGVPWILLSSIYPSGLPVVDEEPLLKTIFQSTAVRRADLVDVNTTEGSYLVNRRFYAWLQKQIESDSQRVGNTLLLQFKAQGEKSMSISSVSISSSSTIHVTPRHRDDIIDEEPSSHGRGKKAKKGSKGATRAGDDTEPPMPSVAVKSGKKSSDLKKKGQRGNTVSEVIPSSTASASTSLSPFVEDHRLVGLVKDCCRPLVDFLEGRVRSDSRDSIDEASEEEEDSEVWTALYVGLWESLKEQSLDLYHRVAAKAKEEASQVSLSPSLLMMTVMVLRAVSRIA